LIQLSYVVENVALTLANNTLHSLRGTQAAQLSYTKYLSVKCCRPGPHQNTEEL